MWNKLLRPFHYIAGEKALLIGVVFSVAASVIAMLNELHFNGSINLKFIGYETADYIYFLEPFIDVLVLSGVLSLAALVLKKHFRIIDLIGTQLLARAPILIMTVLISFSGMTRASSQAMLKHMGENPEIPSDLIPLIVTALLSLPFLIYMLYLMYQAFSISTNASGVKAIVLFIAAFIISEIILFFLYNNLYPIV
tara:strand:- start:6874 stop:7461 length:588 start_codon:yes stop_codon:yes gene_type:complete